MLTAGIITSSDKASQGLREDESGKLIEELLTEAGYQVLSTSILPDDIPSLCLEMKRLSDDIKVNLIVTTGGTGFSLRDVTPEATLAVIDREVQGIPEAIRAISMTKTPHAMLSRARAGMRGQTLIINLPGSPKAVREALELVLGPLEHGIKVMLGQVEDCAKGGKHD